MFLSIIIPVHNTEKYICDCLDSCLEQNIPLSDYEIICINDCSTDGSLDVLQEYKKQNSNIRIITFTKNKGVSAARNAGLDCMNGDYCMFLDSDDYLADNCLKKLKNAVKKENNMAIVCFGRYNFKDANCTNRQDNIKNGKYYGCPTKSFITNRIIHSSLVKNIRFQEKCCYGEDEVFELELETFSPKIITINEPIYFYRHRTGSAMKELKTSRKKQLRRLDSLIDSAVYIRKKYGLSEKKYSDFFNERKELALDVVFILPFYLSFYYILKLFFLRIIFLKKSFFQQRLEVIKSVVHKIFHRN